MITDGKTNFVLQDHLGSARLIVDGLGKITRLEEYETFGRSISDGTGDLSFGFAGLMWDTPSQSYLTLARSYSPRLSQWLQTEPLKSIFVWSQESRSLHAYSGSDPVNFLDRDGLKRENVGIEDFYDHSLWQTAFANEHQWYMTQAQSAWSHGNYVAAYLWSFIDSTADLVSWIPQPIIMNWAKAFDSSLGATERGWGALSGTFNLGLEVGLLGLTDFRGVEKWIIERGLHYGRGHHLTAALKLMNLAEQDPEAAYTGYLLLNSIFRTREWFHFPLLPGRSLEKFGLGRIRDKIGNPHFGKKFIEAAGDDALHFGLGDWHFYSWSKGVWAKAVGKDRVTYPRAAEIGLQKLWEFTLARLQKGMILSPILVSASAKNAEGSSAIGHHLCLWQINLLH